MEIEKIVLKAGSELPSSCRECLLSRLAPRKGGLFDVRCSATQKYTKTKQIPSWCPLQVEDECRWKGELVCGANNTTYYDYIPPKDCSNSIAIPEWLQKEYHFCPVCGKRIRYVESEE